MSRRVVGPFNRVEGDLEVSLELADGKVAAAWVNSPLFRGFEHMLLGRDPRDALVLVPRICGICSVSQSAAAAAALAQAAGVQPPANGRLAGNLLLAGENLADHFSHFYLFFMPDFARPCYAAQPWHPQVAARFQAVAGSAHADALPARRDFLKLHGLLAGKWPHTLALQPGGSSRPIDGSERVRLLALLRQFRSWLETRLFGGALEAFSALTNLDALCAWAAARPASDLALFLACADTLGLTRLGVAQQPMLSFGAYAQDDGAVFPAGYWDGDSQPLQPEAISEDVSHAWLQGDVALPPTCGTTVPAADKPAGYTWCKAPRLHGRPAQTGALARQVLAGHPLARALACDGGVLARVMGRLLELARVVPQMEAWVQALRPGEPFHKPWHLPEEADAVGLVEAARGSLGHWLSIRRGRIARYQIIAPTTWNFSPRDAAGIPGPLEQALVGTPVEPQADPPVAVQHVVRSFDPCMVCTVH